MCRKRSSSQNAQGFVWEVILTLYTVHSSSLSISDGKGAAVTATVRLDAMSANIAKGSGTGPAFVVVYTAFARH